MITSAVLEIVDYITSYKSTNSTVLLKYVAEKQIPKLNLSELSFADPFTNLVTKWQQMQISQGISHQAHGEARALVSARSFEISGGGQQKVASAGVSPVGRVVHDSRWDSGLPRHMSSQPLEGPSGSMPSMPRAETPEEQAMKLFETSPEELRVLEQEKPESPKSKRPASEMELHAHRGDSGSSKKPKHTIIDSPLE